MNVEQSYIWQLERARFLAIDHRQMLKETPDFNDATIGLDVSGKESDKPAQDSTENEGGLLCKACRRIITHEKARISLQGSHQHTFANPHGRVFEIGLFLRAPGCAYQGPLTPEFSWFSGYQWKLAICRDCGSHLGWLFVTDANQFNGLILNRLVHNVH